MMAILQRMDNKEVLLSQLEVATTFINRGVGLLGRSNLKDNEALWIHSCNSIHTFFMKFSIDCVFVDKNLKVVKVVENVSPWRLVLPIWGAQSVFELKAGLAAKLKVKVGDTLYVGN